MLPRRRLPFARMWIDGNRRGLKHQLRQLAGSFERLRRAVTHDGFRDAIGLGLIAEFAKGGSQLAGRDGIEQLGCRATTRLIHAHVERAVASEREPTLGIIDLHARHAEIGDKAMASLQAQPGKDGRKAREVAVVQRERRSDGCELFTGRRQAAGIKVKCDETPHIAGAAQQFDRMSSRPERAVHDRVARPRVQGGQHLVKHDGSMPSRRGAALAAMAVHAG